MFITNFLLNLAYIINLFIPKKSNQIFFYSTPDYSDNARALYEEIVREGLDKKYSIVWAVKDIKKYSKILKTVTVVQHRTVRNLWHFCRSKYLVRTHSLWGNKYVKGRQIMCVVWHGMPLKSLLLPNEVPVEVKCDIINSTAPFFDKELCRAMLLRPEMCKHVGLPRNDELFRSGNELEKMFPGYKKRLIWMPTFRQTATYTNGIDSELGIPCITKAQLEELNNNLKKLNYLLILKLHPWSADKLRTLSYSNIVNFRDADIPEDVSLYKLLGQTDALITDYSSVYVDYLLVSKPICFVFDDIEEYRRTRGFAFEPIEDYMPGVKINNFNDFVGWLNSFETLDEYMKKREELKALFFVYPDGSSAKRLLKELKLI